MSYDDLTPKQKLKAHGIAEATAEHAVRNGFPRGKKHILRNLTLHESCYMVVTDSRGNEQLFIE